ncbi:MAG: cbb3-type cytochrome c oxidase subunit I, partial [Ktedonobacterales bacterium]|nr:cbb3-type cytochrome c oxidase subunit I [Ktedonobacterales bacterium]
FTEQGITIGFIGLVLGWMIGIGALKLPFTWLLALRDPDHAEELRLAGQNGGKMRYFRFTTDHKVVGVQYLVLVLIMLGLGGIGAMLIRTELIQPGAKAFPTETYNTIVTMHGMLMILATITMFIGPFGNFIVPIMIGARDMAFPRLNALSFAFLVPAIAIFLFIPFLGGAQTGWTVYAPLADQTQAGMTALAFSVALAGISSTLGAVNVITTIVTMRAPGMTWTRVPMFVWGILGAAILAALGTAAFTADLILILMDRLYDTSFFVAQTGGNSIFGGTANAGGSAYLSQNLFWFFGHPEVYLIVLPAFGVVMELLPVFTRKPLFGYKMAVLGIMGVVVLNFLVWMHHEFLSGFLADLRPFYMATTELISIPTGFIFLVAIGTLWRGRVMLTIPMLFCLAFIWNFVIGGLSGVFLSDVPADIQLHGSFFVTAHFHFTMVGGALFGFFAAVYYWFPKITGRMLDERLGWIHFWGAQIGFNVAFLSMMYVGLQGMPRRVADYDPRFTTANVITSIFAFVLAASIAVFFYNVAASWVAGAQAARNPWAAQTLEWQVPTPVPLENFEAIPVVTSAPYNYGTPERAPIAASGAAGGEAAG